MHTTDIWPSGIGQASPSIHHLTISQRAVFLINSRQGYFRCGLHHFRHFCQKCENVAWISFTYLYLIHFPNITKENASIFFSSIHSLFNTLWNHPKWWRQALSLTYGCFFAEFLEDTSLVRLGLLDLITCVGLRYGFNTIMLRSFSWKLAPSYLPTRRQTFMLRSDLCNADLPTLRPHDTYSNPIMSKIYRAPSLHCIVSKSRNINRVSITSGFHHTLRPD